MKYCDRILWFINNANIGVKTFFNKEFRTDRIGRCVEAWIAFLGKEHLAHKAFELCPVFGKDPKLIFIQIT